MSVFFNSNHELRSGWKFLIYVIVLVVSFVVGGIALSFLVSGLDLENNQIVVMGLNVAVQLFASVTALVFVARFVDHVPVGTFGVSLHEKWGRDFLAGAVIAALMLAVSVLGCMLFGNLDIQRNTMATIGAIAALAAVLVAAAAVEELMFRGYPMQTLMKGIGTWPAILLMSILFGLAHANNPNVSRLGIINTILAGVLLSVAYLKTRSLWLPFGLHFAWNAGLGLILGFSLSGINTASFWISTAQGGETLLGGAYGPEGGVVGTIAFIAGVGFIRVWNNRNSFQEIQ